MMKLEFVKDEENYEVRVTNGDAYDWEVAGTLVKDENGVWSFDYVDDYGDQSIEYEESLEETEMELKEEFENGLTDDMALSFGSYSYEK